MEDILEYLSIESASMRRPQLEFVRTSDVGGTRFWLWTFDGAGRQAYFSYSQYKEGGLLSTDPAREDPEGYMKRIDDKNWA